MPVSTALRDAARLFLLQQAIDLAQGFSECLESEAIAQRVTDGLVERFDCVLARLWLLDSDQTALKLVASSGLSTRLDGRFGRVPIGAYKVGKIAQNRVSFLSNNLPTEPWVGDRQWAIDNQIQGFAGYPLAVGDRVIGVLATFSHTAMQPEFLEVLQILCTIATIAIDTALQCQQKLQINQAHTLSYQQLPLSEQLVPILNAARLTLVGTERSLSLPQVYIMLQIATTLEALGCTYCRLIYTETTVALEAIVSNHAALRFDELELIISSLNGSLQSQTSADRRSIQVILTLPYCYDSAKQSIRIRCRSSVLQLAFTQLSLSAGLRICHADDDVPLLTDDAAQIHSAKRVIWIQTGAQALPKEIQAVNLLTSADELRQVVDAVMRDQTWQIDPAPSVLSNREIEILTLLTQGHRDRDIADCLMISESTVKFHINNVLAKLKARTRYQAIHQAMVQGWIH